MAQLITLTTDFGAADWFVGTMKGVITGIAPSTRIIDLTHGIPSGDIRAGAFALASAWEFFPRGTIHVAVVDPGVGTIRKALAIQTDRATFIGPDNGALSWALRNEKIRTIRALENHAYFLQPLSRTFHGRDLFAPVAAHLSRGVAIHQLGPAVNDFVRLPWPEPRQTKDGIRGEVIYVDRFGNAITNIDAQSLKSSNISGLAVFRGRGRLCPVSTAYQAVPPGRAVALLGSTGFLEIAVNGASAAHVLKLRASDQILVRRA